MAVTKQVPALPAVNVEPDIEHDVAEPVVAEYETFPSPDPPLVARLKAVPYVPLVEVTVKVD